jgi:hypothetical protein
MTRITSSHKIRFPPSDKFKAPKAKGRQNLYYGTEGFHCHRRLLSCSIEIVSRTAFEFVDSVARTNAGLAIVRNLRMRNWLTRPEFTVNVTQSGVDCDGHMSADNYDGIARQILSIWI